MEYMEEIRFPEFRIDYYPHTCVLNHHQTSAFKLVLNTFVQTFEHNQPLSSDGCFFAAILSMSLVGNKIIEAFIQLCDNLIE